MPDRPIEPTSHTPLVPALRWTAHSIVLAVGSLLILLAWQPQIIYRLPGTLLSLALAGLPILYFYYASFRKSDPRLVLGAVILLIAATSLLVFFTRGHESPFFIVYILVLFLSSVLYSSTVALLLTLLAMIMYIGAILLYPSRPDPESLNSALIVTRLAILSVSGWLISLLRRSAPGG